MVEAEVVEVEVEEVEVVEAEVEEVEWVVEDGMVEILVTDIEDHQFANIILDMFLGGHRHIGLQMNVKMVVQKLVIIHGDVNILEMVLMIAYLPMTVMGADSSVVVYTYIYIYRCCK